MSREQGAVVVTGGNRGIGAAIADRLLEDGWDVVSIARHPPTREHHRLHGVIADCADPEELRLAAADIADRFAVVGLVHNAGVIRPALLEEVALEDVEYLTRLHLEAAIVLAQTFLPTMKREGFGRIVNISSRGALGLATRSAYAATKAGLIGMTRTWALELGPHGITANVVAPGPTVTDMFHEIVPEDSDQKRALARSIPVRRLGEPEDVAQAVAFLCDRRSGFITGQTLYVCGGTSVGSLQL
ncbi:MAG: SDR family oxidoreductase [Alphaproteobacteria bacterium]|nr:MAG: SDR family oxidoreductase [Alphaproteobacteria bacterium]